jgi:hypothetical protein
MGPGDSLPSGRGRHEMTREGGLAGREGGTMVGTLQLFLEAGLTADVALTESSGFAVTEEMAKLVGFEAYKQRSANAPAHLGLRPFDITRRAPRRVDVAGQRGIALRAVGALASASTTCPAQARQQWPSTPQAQLQTLPGRETR